MSIQEINRLINERDELQHQIEEECRDTFVPGSKVYYYHGQRRVVVEVIGPEECSIHQARVRNPKTGIEYLLLYEAIKGFAA